MRECLRVRVTFSIAFPLKSAFVQIPSQFRHFLCSSTPAEFRFTPSPFFLPTSKKIKVKSRAFKFDFCFQARCMCTQTHRHATECQTRNWVRVEILFTAGVPAYIILLVMKAMLTSGCVEAFERKAYIYIYGRSSPLLIKHS